MGDEIVESHHVEPLTQPSQPSKPSRPSWISRPDDVKQAVPMYAIDLPKMLNYFNPYFHGNAYVPHSDIPCEFYTEFVSHVWRTGWFYKWLSLCMRYNLVFATYCSNVVVFVIVILQNLDSHLDTSIFPVTKQNNMMVIVGVFDESLVAGKGISRGIGIVVPIGMMVFLFVLFFGHRFRGRRLGHKSLFLDKASIAQCPNYHHIIDTECPPCQQKLLGIRSIGNCLRQSKELIILWDRFYFRRLWTVFEIGVYIGERGTADVQFLPIYMNAAMILWFVLIALIMTFTSVAGLVESSGTKVGTQYIYVVAMFALFVFFCLFFWILRRQISLQQNMMSELMHFSLDNAECYREEDRHFVKLHLVGFKRPQKEVSNKGKDAFVSAMRTFRANAGRRRWLARQGRRKRRRGCLTCVVYRRLRKSRLVAVESGGDGRITDTDCNVDEDVTESPKSEIEPVCEPSDHINIGVYDAYENVDSPKRPAPDCKRFCASASIVDSRSRRELPIKISSLRKHPTWRLHDMMKSSFRYFSRHDASYNDDNDEIRDGIRRFEHYVHTELVDTLNKKVGMYGGNVVLPLRTIIIPCFPMTWAVLDYNIYPLNGERIVSDLSYALSFAFIFGPLFGFICVKIATLSLAHVPQIHRHEEEAALPMRWQDFGKSVFSVITSADYLILLPGGLLNVIVVMTIYLLWVAIYHYCVDLWYILLLIYSVLLTFVLYVYSPSRYEAQLRSKRLKNKAVSAKHALAKMQRIIAMKASGIHRRATMSPSSTIRRSSLPTAVGTDIAPELVSGDSSHSFP